MFLRKKQYFTNNLHEVCKMQCCHLEPSTGALRLKGGGRIARERMGILTPKKWEQNKVRGGGGVSKKARNVAVPDSDKTQKMSKEDKEKLRAKKQSYKELIQRSKKQRDDRKRKIAEEHRIFSRGSYTFWWVGGSVGGLRSH